MAIEYLRGGIFLFVGDEGHFDSLVSRGYYSPVPDHEIPYDLRLEIQDRLDARGVKGSSARQSTGTNEAGKNCWAPNKPCGKACRVNCKSGSGTVGAKTKKAAAQQMVSEALAKKKGAAGGKKTKAAKPSGPMDPVKAGEALAAVVGKRKPKPKAGDPPKPKYDTKISGKDYDRAERQYIEDVRSGKMGHGEDSESYANMFSSMDPKTRRGAIGGHVENRIINERRTKAERANVPALRQHHDINDDEFAAGVNAAYSRAARTPLGQDPGFSKMSEKEKADRFGNAAIKSVLSAREQSTPPTSKSTKSRKPAAPKATKAKAASAPKAKAPSRQKQLEAQLAADPFFADIMRRRRDSHYDSFDFIPYYATTGLPTLVDPFGAFR